ncbi:putative enterotoxin [Ophiocordyceps australis]|uniref:Putative enterotoxin n=1 Tax=Ophiocordyceps australis TaxID=1399860 RepID=A0A2C5YB78_9HYPO|nr:putative enterotoxin [Ophiocordyceps australis]
MIFSRFANVAAPASLLCLFWLGYGNASIVPHAPNAVMRRAPDDFVYRGDTRGPDKVRPDGGFQPSGYYWNNPSAFNIHRHVRGDPVFMPRSGSSSGESNSLRRSRCSSSSSCPDWADAYVSTAVLANEAAIFAYPDEDGNFGYLYRIHITPNMLTVQSQHEREVAALGGIPWSAVSAYTQLRSRDEEFPSVIPESRWTENPDFDPEWNRFSTAMTASTLLEGPDAMTTAITLMDRPSIGGPMGWSGQFPLFGDHHFVYRGDARSPQEIAQDGGFQPQGDGWQNQGSAFHFDRHYAAGPNGCGLEESGNSGFVFRTAYVTLEQDRDVAETQGSWLYEIRATPNMIDDNNPETDVFALGGVHWSQIRRYTNMTGNPGERHRVDEAAWINNPNYDAATYQRGESAVFARVNGNFPEVLRNGNTDSGGSDGPSCDRDRRAMAAARNFMTHTRGMRDLYGPFPPRFSRYPAIDGIPGPGPPPPPETVDAQGKKNSFSQKTMQKHPHYSSCANNC